MGKKIMGCPGWLELSADRESFILVQDRAEIVRKIFEEALSGIGGYTIARRLNAGGVPPFGPSRDWQQSNINNLLRNRATVGEFQPRRLENGKRVPGGEPIAGYYPAVINEELFEAVQVARQENLAHRRGRKGEFVSNLFSGTAKCAYCGSRMKLENIGVKSQPSDINRSFVCSMALKDQSCVKDRWQYSEFEKSFLSFVSKTALMAGGDFARLVPYIDRLSEHDLYKARLSLAAQLKRSINTLSIGTEARARFFKVEFSDKLSWTIYPKNPA